MMPLPDPRQDNFWRKRILTDEEMAEVIAAVETIEDEARQRANAFAGKVQELKAEMLKNGYTIHSPEYKYVGNRIEPQGVWRSLRSNIQTTQADLKRKAEEERKAQAQREREQEMHKAKLAKLVEDAKTLGIDPLAHFGDEAGLKEAVKAAKESKLEHLLTETPYYIRASFYGQCLRGDWSEGRDSYGLDQLLELDIPPEDPNPDRPALHRLAVELREIAGEWDGEDGRDFRETYQELDAHLNKDEATIRGFMCTAHDELRYGW